MAHAHVHGDLTLDNLVAHDPAWALRVLVEHLPHDGQLNGAEFPARLKW